MAGAGRQPPFRQDEGQHKQPPDQAAQANSAQRIEVIEHHLLRHVPEAPQSGGEKEQQVGCEL